MNALATQETERRIAERISPAESRRLTISSDAGGITFTDMAQVLEFAKMMAVSAVAVPKHLRGNPGACLAVVLQAVEWRMSPYAVANKSYSVNDRLAYESQLIQAVILQRAPIKGRFKVRYDGDGERRTCTVIATLDDGSGETVEYTSPEFGKIQPKNSPLWKTDPDQQHFYYSGRALCRRHFPDVLLGIYDKEELEDAPRDPAAAKDVSPKGLNSRLDALAASKTDPAVVDDFVDLASEAEQSGQDDDPGEGIDHQDEVDVEHEIDPQSPDYARGISDAKAGQKKCVLSAILKDEARFANWKAGFESIVDEAA